MLATANEDASDFSDIQHGIYLCCSSSLDVVIGVLVWQEGDMSAWRGAGAARHF